MAYETKVLLKMLSEYVSQAKSIKQIYGFIQRAAAAEGMTLPSYEEIREILQKEMEDED